MSKIINQNNYNLEKENLQRLEDKVGKFYGNHHKTSGRQGIPALKRNFDHIENYFGLSKEEIRNKSFLEAGGIGGKAIGMAASGVSKVGFIDLSEENTSWVKEISDELQFGIEVIHDSLTNQQINQANKYDIIMCSGVIHHTTNPAQCLINLYNWLNQDGLLHIDYYRSDGLQHLPALMGRELLGLVSCDYQTFAPLLEERFQKEPSLATWRRPILDHLFVPIYHQTKPSTFEKALTKFDFDILKRDEDTKKPINCVNTKGEFIVKKNGSGDCTLSSKDFTFHTDPVIIDQEVDPELTDLISLFRDKKEAIASKGTEKVISISIELFSIMNQSQYLYNWRHRIAGLNQTRSLKYFFMSETPLQHFIHKSKLIFNKF